MRNNNYKYVLFHRVYTLPQSVYSSTVCVPPPGVTVSPHQVEQEGVQAGPQAHRGQDAQAHPVGTPQEPLLQVLHVLQMRREDDRYLTL